MEWPHLLAFNATLLAAIASPGPSFVYLTRTAMVHGRRAGILAALGLAVMAAMWTLAALLGLQVLFEIFPWAMLAMKTLGGAYLIWIAIQTWRSAKKPLAQDVSPSQGRHFTNGLLVNLANPKSILFAGAVIVAIFPPTLSGTEKALIFINHLSIEMVIQPALAVLFSTAIVRQRYLASKSIFDRIAGSIMGALGLRLILDRAST